MTVSALIKILQKCDPKFKIIISKDAEGNGFSPLADHSTAKYEPNSTWSGEINEEAKKDAVILWPIN